MSATSHRSDEDRDARGRRSDAKATPATVTLALVSFATVVGFVRVFDSPAFLVPVLAITAAAHVTAAATRRARWWWSVPVMLVGGALVTTWITHASATTFGVPTTSTVRAITHDLDAAVEVLRSRAAPVAPDPGLLFVIGIGMWIVAWAADRLTFSYDAPGEAIAPSATVFVIVTALAGPSHRWACAALYGGTVALHVLVRRNVGPADPTTHGRVGASWRPIARGAVIAAVSLVVGLTAAATVPALASPGVIRVRNKPTITVVSPLVDIASTLVDHSNTEMFRVTADRPAYWRLMALDAFDGTRWTPPTGSLPEAGGYLARDDRADPDYRQITATFRITGLGGRWAPAPYRTTSVSHPYNAAGKSVTFLWDRTFSTLLASGAGGDVAGLTYTTVAEIPHVGAQDLAAATGPVPADLQHHFTELPATVRAELAPIADTIVADATTPYQKALALQNYFRDPTNGFVYSTDVAPTSKGESIDAIRAFLSSRRGFCEQYAGTFGALARSIGLPTRIAVGFTEGRPDSGAGSTTTWDVTGGDAHAWPEVYFEGLGWLPFEPTPGKSNPIAGDYAPTSATATVPPGTTAPAMTPTTRPGAAGPSTTQPASPTTIVSPGNPPQATVTVDHTRTPRRPWLPAVAAVGVLVIVGLGPLMRLVWRRRRQRSADTPARRLRVVWADALAAWAPLGIRRRLVDTDRDLGRRIAARIGELETEGVQHPDVPRLAELAGAAAWNADGITDDDVEEARDLAASVRRFALDHRSRRSRLIGWFDPRVPRSDVATGRGRAYSSARKRSRRRS
ncbi:MAG: transglutaminase domain-containing protein [Actinobacteria bacterium]|nr:transglutaminase domain-containing protein [Actinomycetota bacterium]